MVRLHSTGLSFSSVLCPATRRRRGKVGLEAGAARYNVSNVDRECTQITINLGGSLQLPAEAALLCKDWLAIRAQAGVRSSTNRERESCRRHPYQMLSFEKDDTHTPSSLCCVVVLSGYHRRAPFNCPTIQRTNWNASRFPLPDRRRQYFHQIIAESSSSIFCPKTDNTRSGGGAATLLQRSVNLQKAIDFDLCVCIQQLERAPHETRYK